MPVKSLALSLQCIDEQIATLQPGAGGLPGSDLPIGSGDGHERCLAVIRIDLELEYTQTKALEAWLKRQRCEVQYVLFPEFARVPLRECTLAVGHLDHNKAAWPNQSLQRCRELHRLVDVFEDAPGNDDIGHASCRYDVPRA